MMKQLAVACACVAPQMQGQTGARNHAVAPVRGAAAGQRSGGPDKDKDRDRRSWPSHVPGSILLPPTAIRSGLVEPQIKVPLKTSPITEVRPSAPAGGAAGKAFGGVIAAIVAVIAEWVQYRLHLADQPVMDVGPEVRCLEVRFHARER